MNLEFCFSKMQRIILKNGMQIVAFISKDSFLSNFAFSPFSYDGYDFCCVEQAYVVLKLKFHKIDASNLLKFGHCDDKSGSAKQQRVHPRVFKQRGKRMLPKESSSWRERKVEVMTALCRAKFQQNTSLKNTLLSTGNAPLLEANEWDSFWGIGMSSANPKLLDWTRDSREFGKNVLGGILEKLRAELGTRQANISICFFLFI